MKGAGVALLTGGSGGIGKDTASLLAAKGYTVYELSRSGQDADGIRHIGCDVADAGAVDAAVKRIISAEGKIDLLINNAGIGISGAVEFASEEDVRRIFDVNFFGVFNALRAVIPHMRERRSGRIINIGSVAGEIAIPFQAFYSATKAAVLSLTLALRNELKPFGISVSAVLPGDAATGFTVSRKKEHTGDAVYGGRIGRSVSRMERDERGGMSSRYAARKIVRAALKKNAKPKYVIGFVYKIYSVLFPVIPSSLSSLIVRILYAR